MISHGDARTFALVLGHQIKDGLHAPKTLLNVGPAPDCAAAVSLNGEVVFEKAFGLPDLEHNVPKFST